LEFKELAEIAVAVGTGVAVHAWAVWVIDSAV